MDAARRDLVRSARSLRDDIDMSLRSIRNRALTDAITAGYETRQELRSIKNDAGELLKSKKEEALDGLESARKEILETLERYL